MRIKYFDLEIILGAEVGSLKPTTSLAQSDEVTSDSKVGGKFYEKNQPSNLDLSYLGLKRGIHLKPVTDDTYGSNINPKRISSEGMEDRTTKFFCQDDSLILAIIRLQTQTHYDPRIRIMPTTQDKLRTIRLLRRKD